MLTMVSAENTAGQLFLPLLDASAGYLVKDIQGLDPGKATLVSSSIAQKDGADLHNKRREPRNIILKIGIQSDWVTNSVASLRWQLYQYFMPKAELSFSLYSDDVLFGSADAVVESFESELFAADPEVSISLICYDPDFSAPAPAAWGGMSVSDLSSSVLTYPGTSDTGIIFTMTFPAAASSVAIYNTRPDRIIHTMNINGTFQSGDTIKVNTNHGQKDVSILRSGLTIPVLYYLNRDSSWIQLGPGDNLFRAYYSGVSTPYQVEYTAKYGGY